MPKKNSKNNEKQTSNVFILDPDVGWRPAVLEETRGHTAICTVPQYKDEQKMMCDGGRASKSAERVEVDLRHYPHNVLPLQNCNNVGDLVEYADMVKLPYLHEVR